MNNADVFIRMANSGFNLAEIGRQHGISRQAVDQAIRRKFGGAYQFLMERNKEAISEIRQATDKKKRQAKAKERCRRQFLCTIEEYEATGRNFAGSSTDRMASRYREQYRNAKRRSIEWTISFPYWLQLLEASGKLEDRKYVVGRKSLKIGFTIENVEVKHLSQCSMDGILSWLKPEGQQ